MTGAGRDATPRPEAAPGPVVTAEPADAGALSQIIADAFFDLPQSRWLIPNLSARRELLPGYFRLYVEHAMESGVVQTNSARTAAALWLPVGGHAAAEPAGYRERLAAATGHWLDRFLAFDATLDRHHPEGSAHHHLAILAVRPDQQARGTGGTLLRAYHQLLDHAGAAAYLEAAEPRSRRLYLRHGYAVRPGGPFYLPDGGPPMWPMWREPPS